MTYDARKDAHDSYFEAIAALRERFLKEKAMKEEAAKHARRVEVIGACTLYLGDCMEIMPHLGKVDAVVTDPPYGIDYGKQGSFKATHGWGPWRENVEWDKERPSKEYFDAILCCSKIQVIWGGNYFADLLPPTMQWLVWDKGQRDFSLADCEFAWSSENRAARVFDYARSKAMRDGKQHPTQKPIALMEWCFDVVGLKNGAILDPFMGSGTTGVACVKKGFSFIGIEQHEPYFDIACERIRKAYAQPDMFVEQPRAPQPTQESLL